MGSATSFFNSTIYRKTMARYWPLWALYGVIWAFAIPLNLMASYFNALRWEQKVSQAQETLLDNAVGLPGCLELGLCLSLVFGVLAAMAAFGYLYNNRAACTIHALPVRREALFWSNYLAGFSFLLLPQLAAGLMGAVVELALLPSSNWGEALPALGTIVLVQSGTALFFFSFAAFCAMFTGHILALPAFYGILNGLVITVYFLVTSLMDLFFFGYSGMQAETPLVRYLTPVYALEEACRWQTVYSDSGEAVSRGLESPGTVAAYAAAGVVLAVLALLVYQRRHVESAGDVVAVPLVRPLFRYGVAFCAGLSLGVCTAAFFNWTDALPMSLFVILWSVVGCFAAEMLLKKSFRVLTYWKHALAVAAAMALLCAAFTLDLFGVEDKVPDAGEVASLSVYTSLGYPYDTAQDCTAEVTDREQIQKFIDLHRAIIRDKDRVDPDSDGYQPGEDYIYFRVTYTLTSGATLERRYYSIPVYREERDLEGSVTWLAQQLNQDRDLVEERYGFDRCEEGRLVEAYLTDLYQLSEDGSRKEQSVRYLDGVTLEELEGLWQAVRADFKDGTIGVRYLFDDRERMENTMRTDLTFSFEITDRDSRGETLTHYRDLDITLTPNAKRTLAWLEEHSGLGESYELRPHTAGEEDEGLWDTVVPEEAVAYTVQEA